MSGRILTLVHVTTPERAVSISSEGLVPGDENRCNYDCNRWMPLDGVYLSQSCNQISGYRRAHGLVDCGVVVVEADDSLLLPDEDVIDSLLAESLQSVMGVQWDEIARRNEEDLMPPSGDPFWDRVRDDFARRSGPRSVAELRDDDLDVLVDWWADFQFFGEGGDVCSFEWAELKDRVVRAFPRMEGMSLEQRSKRHPGAIGFEGGVRIVGIACVEDGVRRDLFGAVPDCGLVDAALDADDWWMRAGSDEDSRVFQDDGDRTPGDS